MLKSHCFSLVTLASLSLLSISGVWSRTAIVLPGLHEQGVDLQDFARTPERMAVIATLLGGGAVLAGIEAAFALDSPTGPTIVCTAAILFALSNLSRLLRR